MSNVLLGKLLSKVNKDGGWGYKSGQYSSIEPTCLALLATKAFLKKEELIAVQEFLEKSVTSQGTVVQPNCPRDAVWPTALTLFTMQQLEIPSAKIPGMIGAVLAISGMTTSNPKAMEIHGRGIDLSIVGWPWTVGAFSWVEPTSWAVLALKAANLLGHERYRQGIRFLKDRILDSGGSNYGNKVVLGKSLEPVPIPSAMTLIALQGEALNPQISNSLEYIIKTVELRNDIQDVAWGIIALSLWNESRQYSGIIDEAIPWVIHEISSNSDNDVSVNDLALGLILQNLKDHNPFEVRKLADSVAFSEKARFMPFKEGIAERFKSTLKRWLIAGLGGVSTAPEQSLISAIKISENQTCIDNVVQKLYEPFRETVPLKGKVVFLKPNMVEIHPSRPIHTNPAIVEAMVKLCIKEGASIVRVGEGSGHRRNMEAVLADSGLGAILRNLGVEFVDLNTDEVISVPNLGFHTGFKNLYFSKKAYESQVLVSMPKLKTHHWATVTLSLKNLFGIASGQAYGWPKNELHFRGIDNSICDINSCRKADLVLVDALTGMEGDGPLYGEKVNPNALVMGSDPVAVDATCARWMGFDPAKISHILKCANSGVGNMDLAKIRIDGNSLETFLGREFIPPPGEFAS